MIMTILGIVFGLAVLGVIFSMLLRRKLREKYAVLWILIGIVILVLTIFPEMLGEAAQMLGVAVPANLLFILALALLIGVTLHQSWELSANEDETRRLAEEVAILRAQVDRLSADASVTEDSAPPADEAS